MNLLCSIYILSQCIWLVVLWPCQKAAIHFYFISGGLGSPVGARQCPSDHSRQTGGGAQGLQQDEGPGKQRSDYWHTGYLEWVPRVYNRMKVQVSRDQTTHLTTLATRSGSPGSTTG
jgi:hypothetical protein